LRDERRYVETLARLRAVFSLSPDTFGPSGAKSKTSIVVLERNAQEGGNFSEEYPVFIADVQQVGYDFTGRATGKNDLPLLVSEYLKFKETGKSDSAISRVVMRSELGTNWLAQPHIQMPDTGTTNEFEKLGGLCDFIGTGKQLHELHIQMPVCTW
jgi:hypothetical protein